MPAPKSGDVWRYDYLWRWQHDAGETEGRKSRPVSLVAVVIDKDGKTNLFILPITSSPPSSDRLALEVPEIERRRAGLNDMPLWIILDEYNHDLFEGSFYLDPSACIGRFSEAFQRTTLNAFLTAAKSQKTRRVPRTD
ncbi:hypothetical protein GCM10007874_07990 [Labrys miyagiensis]|uniref:PemK-like, MazF-like toxin of type II toxin-antitoxin system n=1 Tax=Labrys miyagiensis TaxID=346912 RepID=A0ABQ6CC68_9HYPH|nr:hypothetical protein [Labrys miyagiensis]GLS17784.1 hypothetical protein GCM10007874_07990 [Labrys miyagiensis]